MAKVRLLRGKPLTVDGKVALSDDCCCGSGPPPGACPISVTFNGLEFCCACDGFGGVVEYFEDVDNQLNGIPLPVTTVMLSCQFCQFDREPIASLHGLGGAECPATDDLGGGFLVTLEMTQSGGIWYIMLYLLGLRNILFYGTTSDPTMPVNNLLVSCSVSPTTFSNPMVTCDPDNLAGEFCAVAKNGTATFNF